MNQVLENLAGGMEAEVLNEMRSSPFIQIYGNSLNGTTEGRDCGEEDLFLRISERYPDSVITMHSLCSMCCTGSHFVT